MPGNKKLCPVFKGLLDFLQNYLPEEKREPFLRRRPRRAVSEQAPGRRRRLASPAEVTRRSEERADHQLSDGIRFLLTESHL